MAILSIIVISPTDSTRIVTDYLNSDRMQYTPYSLYIIVNKYITA
jgi:hypothetical protein